MSMTPRILIGYDGSEGGEDALELGRVLLEGLGGVAVVASVLQIPSHLMSRADLDAAIAQHLKPLFDAARERLSGFEVNTLAGADSSPGRGLHAAIASEAPTITVIGSSRRGAVGRLAVGDVGGGLLSGAACSLAVAPVGYATRDEKRLREVGVAMDGGDESWNAFETAAALAARLHAQLTAVLVARPLHFGYGAAAEILTEGAYEGSERRKMRGVAEEAAARMPDGVPFRTAIKEHDDVPAAVAEAAPDLDLLVIGSRGYGPVRGAFLGSVSRRLVHMSSSPLLVLPRGAGRDPLRLSLEASRGGSASESISPSAQ